MKYQLVRNIRYVDGSLAADVADKFITFNRPCDLAALCGPFDFVFNNAAPNLSSCAENVISSAQEADEIIPLRGEFCDFLMFAIIKDFSFSIAALSSKKTTLTVRVEDVWEKILPVKRKYLYRCKVKSATLCNSEQSQFLIAPDARIFIDLNECDGFIMNFSPEDKDCD
jgi:hypothetical protein